MAEVYDQEEAKHHLSAKSFAHWNESLIFGSSTELSKGLSVFLMIRDLAVLAKREG